MGEPARGKLMAFGLQTSRRAGVGRKLGAALLILVILPFGKPYHACAACRAPASRRTAHPPIRIHFPQCCGETAPHARADSCACRRPFLGPGERLGSPTVSITGDRPDVQADPRVARLDVGNLVPAPYRWRNSPALRHEGSFSLRI